MLCEPTPAAEAEKSLPVMPVPLYTPPDGEPFDKVKEGSLIHFGLKAEILAVVTAFTAIVLLALLLQRLAFIYV